MDKYFDGIQSAEGKSVLQIQGGLNSTGTYGCWNQLLKIYRTFTVTLNDGKLSRTETVAVVVSVAVFFVLMSLIVVGFIWYKRRIANVTRPFWLVQASFKIHFKERFIYFHRKIMYFQVPTNYWAVNCKKSTRKWEWKSKPNCCLTTNAGSSLNNVSDLVCKQLFNCAWSLPIFRFRHSLNWKR